MPPKRKKTVAIASDEEEDRPSPGVPKGGAKQVKLAWPGGAGGGGVDGAPVKPKKPMRSLSGLQFVNSFQHAPSSAGAGPSRSTTNGSENAPANGNGISKGKGKQKETAIEIDSSSDESGSARRPLKPKAPIKDEAESGEMWTERFAPTTSADLAPTKQRITTVRNWLEEAITGVPASVRESGVPFSEGAKEQIRRYRRILVLTGPAGVGKTTTIQVLTKELGVECVEWSEGVEEWGMAGVGAREGLTSKLLSFLSRSHYAQLPLGSSSTQASRLLLLSTLPNLSSLATRQAFHAALLDFAKTYTPSSCPLVLIVSNAGATGRAETSWMDRAGDGEWDVRSVLGPEAMAHPAVNVVDFLPMAPTFLVKAMKRIVPLAFPDVKSRPSASALQLIASTANGDLRSAINSLQFLSHGSGKAMASETAKKTKGKGSRGGAGAKVAASGDLRALLDAVSRREQSLGLFHALGKVLYNKRLGDETADSEADPDIEMTEHEPLPAHLEPFERRKFENDIEGLLGTIPVDTSTFGLWLHQNVPQFCTDIDQADDFLDDLCRADTMKADDDLWQRTPHAIQYAFHTLVRGALMALPSPVPRQGQKVFKPEFFGILRESRDRDVALQDVLVWRNSLATLDKRNDEDDLELASIGAAGMLSRDAMLLDILPVMSLPGRKLDLPAHVQEQLDLLRLPLFRRDGEADNTYLEQLTEKEGDLPTEEGEMTLETATIPARRPRSTQVDELEDTVPPADTWLSDDDIDDF